MRVRARAITAAAGAAAVLALAGCGGGAADPAPSSSVSAPVPSATASTAPSASATASDAPSASSTGIVVLPESLLKPISGLEYSDSGIDDADRIKAFSEATGDTSVVAGVLFRELTYKGDPVGGVEIIRFIEAPPAEVTDTFMKQLLDGFAGTSGAATQVPGQPAWQVDSSERSTGAVGWIDGTDVYIIWSSSSQDAMTLADEFLNA